MYTRLQPSGLLSTPDALPVEGGMRIPVFKILVIVPKRQASCPLRFAIGIKQMDPTRKGLAIFILNIKAQPSGMGIEGYHHVEQSKHLESSHSFPSHFPDKSERGN